MRRYNVDLRLSREETVLNQLVSQSSDVTDIASRELTVTVDVTRDPATSIPNSPSVESPPPIQNSSPYITRFGRECKDPAKFMD